MTEIKNSNFSIKLFSVAFWGTIIILLVIYFSAISIYQSTKEESTSDDSYSNNQITSKEELISDRLQANLPSIINNIDDEITKEKTEIDKIIDETIDNLFMPVYKQIPEFADTHYSVMGEYSEIVASLENKIDNRAQNILFNQIAFENNLINSITDIDKQVNIKTQDSINKINTNTKNKISLDNNEMDSLIKKLQLSPFDVQKRFSSLTCNTVKVSGIGLTGTVLTKQISKKLAVKVSTKIATKLASTAATESTGVASGAAIGTFIGGPIGTVVGGIVGGVAAWIVTDTIIIKVDELFNRQEFEQELHQMIDEQKQSIKQKLKNDYADILNKIANEQKEKFKSGTNTDNLSD